MDSRREVQALGAAGEDTGWRAARVRSCVRPAAHPAMINGLGERALQLPNTFLTPNATGLGGKMQADKHT